MTKIANLIWFASLVLLTATSLTSCQHATASKQQLPALLINPSKQTNQELQQALVQLSDASSVRIKDDAFTKKNSLFIERVIIRDKNDLPIMGAYSEMPVVVVLEKQGNNCILRRTSNNQMVVLKTVKCLAIDSSKDKG